MRILVCVRVCRECAELPAFFVGWGDAKGMWHRSGQGLRRGMLLGLCEVERKPGRQRERISARAGTPSGDTTKIP